MSPRKLFAFSLSVVAGLATGCSSSRESPVVAQVSSRVLAGETDDVHTGVVAIELEAGADSELCSGYVITGDLVLTARHCVSPLLDPTGGCVATDAGPATTNGAPHPAKAFTVFFVTALSATSKGVAVAEVIIPPDSTGKATCGNDVALLRLAAPLDGSTAIAPRLDVAATVDESFTAVGYGASAGGPDTTSGTRRSRSGLIVKQVGASARTVEGEWIADKGPCAGDSGGPALDATGRAIGVMSRGNQLTCNGMIYQRLDVHADWLRGEGLASAARLGVDAPAWASTSPDAGGDDAADAAADDATTDAGSEAGTPAAPADGGSGGCAMGGRRASAGSSLPAVSLAIVAALTLAGARRAARRGRPAR